MTSEYIRRMINGALGMRQYESVHMLSDYNFALTVPGITNSQRTKRLCRELLEALESEHGPDLRVIDGGAFMARRSTAQLRIV